MSAVIEVRGMRMIALVISLLALAASAAFASEARAQFGIEPGSFVAEVRDQNGNPVNQAGAHPFEAHTAFEFITTPPDDPTTPEEESGAPVGMVKDIEVTLPPGFIGNPEATPKCRDEQLLSNRCPDDSQVGLASITVWNGTEAASLSFAVFNMVPGPGETADFAFLVLLAPVHVVAKLNTDGDYSLTTVISDTSELLPLIGTSLTLWGVPGDEAHDQKRGQCINSDTEDTNGDGFPDGDGDPLNDDVCPIGAPEVPFLTLPSVCGIEGVTRLRANSWDTPGTFAEATSAPQTLTGCDRQDWNPSISVTADPPAADSPTGLTVDLRIPQNNNPDGLGTPPLRKTVVHLPEGLVVSPSAAAGLGACAPAQIALGSNAQPTCPGSSKIGTVSIETPLLDNPMEGSIYLAQPTANQLLGLYLVVRGPGLLIKLPGTIDPDPATGRLTATFDNTPMVPFSRFLLSFKSGPRAPLATPATCGTKTTTAQLTSWNQNVPVAAPSSSFDVVGCSGGFAPGFVAGATNPIAGRGTGFLLRMSRADGRQEIGGLDVTLPAGLTGRLAAVPPCADAQAAAGTCGDASAVGSARVASGAGSSPFGLSGKVFLTGPYKGAPLGLSIVVPALAGPFDLGTVVVRAAVFVNRRTAQLRVVSDPLPTILRGIPLRLREVEVLIDRSGFMRNPTSCATKRVRGTLRSVAGATAAVSSRFKVADCAALGFRPRLTARFTGRRQVAPGRHPGLRVRLRQRRGQANPRSVALTLPAGVSLDIETLPDPCTRGQLQSLSCPAASRVGSARAVTPLLRAPLSGPVHLVQGRGRGGLPALAAILRGQVTIVLEGRTAFVRGRTRNTFATVPDVPITDFRLNLAGGSRGILSPARRSLCARRQVANVKMRGHNGRVRNARVRIGTPCRRG